MAPPWPAESDYLDFKGLTAKQKQSWADAFMWFYRRLVLKHGGKRLVMKSPGNAARLKLLTKLFPDARFVYIARNPLDVFPSTVKLWRALYSTQGLHNPPNLEGWLDDYVLDMFQRLTEAYEEDRHLISPDRLVEMRYEDLIKDPIGTMRGVYAKLGIGGFDEAEGPMRAILSDRSDHRISSYRLPSPSCARSPVALRPISTASATATASLRRSRKRQPRRCRNARAKPLNLGLPTRGSERGARRPRKSNSRSRRGQSAASPTPAPNSPWPRTGRLFLAC